jgi:transposase
MRRHEISDDHWNRIEALLPGRQGDSGVTAKDNRLFVNAVLWIAKTGAPWRDLPERFGNWNSVWQRFDRWARKGAWERVCR